MSFVVVVVVFGHDLTKYCPLIVSLHVGTTIRRLTDWLFQAIFRLKNWILTTNFEKKPCNNRLEPKTKNSISKTLYGTEYSFLLIWLIRIDRSYLTENCQNNFLFLGLVFDWLIDNQSKKNSSQNKKFETKMMAMTFCNVNKRKNKKCLTLFR